LARIGARWRERRPSISGVVLIAALLLTVAAKFAVAIRQSPDEPLIAGMEACRPDVVFFACCGGVLVVLRRTLRRRWAERLWLLLSLAVLGWSVLNAGWLVATGVQLQRGVLMILVRDPAEFGPIVLEHVRRKPVASVPIILVMIVGIVAITAEFIRPRVAPKMSPAARRGVFVMMVLALAIGWIHLRSSKLGHVAYSGQVIGFSSHWSAIRSAFQSPDANFIPAPGQPVRVLPPHDDRSVRFPEERTDRPNVLIVLLESVSWDASSFGPGGGPTDTTANLVALSRQGVQFDVTRVPIPQTGKAFWSVFAGLAPDLSPDFAESIPGDRPIRSLCTILRERGYRSAFFQMSKGSFECSPGLFWNLGFDEAWFRENLEDESAHLGYMNGDDFRLIDPALNWLKESDEPFVLGVITTVAHDPYDLPAWYQSREIPSDDRYARYLEAVRFTDAFLGEFVAQVTEAGFMENTILCVLGDHGESFRPDARRGRWAPYEEVIRVPWIIRYPGEVDAGSHVAEPVSQLDVTPTLLSLLGASIEGAGFDGIDAMKAERERPRRHSFSCWYSQSPFGWIEGDWKFVYWPSSDRLFRFDLASDPMEKQPLLMPESAIRPAVDEFFSRAAAQRIDIPARRFRELRLYDRWRVFCDGRFGRAAYLPADAGRVRE